MHPKVGPVRAADKMMLTQEMSKMSKDETRKNFTTLVATLPTIEKPKRNVPD